MRAFNRRVTAIGACALALSIPFTTAQSAPPAAAAPQCRVVAPPPAELRAWTAPRAMQAAASVDHSARTSLPIGQAARLALTPTPQVAFPLAPKKPGDAESFGGLVGIDVAEAGTYRVALGTAAWIDLTRSDQAEPSIAHSHGPPCTGIRKMVDFALTPGRYTLQIAANQQSETTILIVRLR